MSFNHFGLSPEVVRWDPGDGICRAKADPASRVSDCSCQKRFDRHRANGARELCRELPLIYQLLVNIHYSVQCGRCAAVGRGRARGVAVGGGLPCSQDGAHNIPSLYWSRVSARADTSLGARYPSPTGGTTRSPIKASASAIVCWMQLASAPLAMFSFAAIN